MDKVDLARRQLGTALALYLDDRDPVSVHTLAHAGAELADGLSAASGSKPFRLFRTSEPGREITDGEFFALRNRYANAFKHFETRGGKVRSDEQLISTFTDSETDALLFMGWFDFAAAGHFHPVESHAFQAWYLALIQPRTETFDGQQLIEALSRQSPGLAALPRARQKKRLRRMIALARADREFMADFRIDRRPLILGALESTCKL